MERQAFLMLAMSLAEAKETLGFSPAANPSEGDITKAWRQKALENHPDRGGSNDVMVEVNVARDVLLGKQRPTYARPTGPTYQETAYQEPAEPTRTRWEKPKAEEVSFEEAKAKAGLPANVEWQFVTDRQKGTGYSSDEYHRSDISWVAYGRTDSKHVFVAARHFVYSQYAIGSGPDKDIWTIRVLDIPIRSDEATQPSWLYGNIVKALNLLDFDGKFNSKVVDARGWTKFDDKLPHGTGVSLKHWLADTGQVAGDDPSVASRKHVVEITYSKQWKEQPHHYQGKDRNGPSDWQAVALVCNGKTEYLNERDITRFMQAGLLRKIFGEYTYGGEKKNLTRMRDGKKYVQLFAEKMDLSAGTKAVLEAAAAQMK